MSTPVLIGVLVVLAVLGGTSLGIHISHANAVIGYSRGYTAGVAAGRDRGHNTEPDDGRSV